MIRNLPLSALVINRANDRHGELENETAAIAWLFNAREEHMRNLAQDIVNEGGLFELPLVNPEGSSYVVYDGNRRVTCLKLLNDPRRAPTAELQEFFAKLKSQWVGEFSNSISCQIETDRDRIDQILFRRHTGSQKGVGQSTWDDRMKATFVARTGKFSGLNVADEIERRLSAANMLPTRRKIPRSTMNRLLSAEPFRNRLGFTVNRGRFEFTHSEDVALAAMARVANDLATRETVLGDIWDVDGKRSYLDRLEREGVLPTASHAISKASGRVAQQKTHRSKPASKATASSRKTLIPQKDYDIAWPGRLQRHHQIWEELQFHLELSLHPNAISVLFRVLLELAVENYIKQTSLAVHDGDTLAARVVKVGKDLRDKGKIDVKLFGVIAKFQHIDKLISADTLNRYVHSPNFAPSPEHLTSLWDSLSAFLVLCLQS